MRGRNEEQLIPLIDFAASQNLILRFIEMMPVSTTEVLTERNFLPGGGSETRNRGALWGPYPRANFPTPNGPATYYQVPGRDQRIGFIGAMTICIL